ncbi:MAG: GC-type dockerin domain-anchored protein [Phycisphaerales bacterium]
MKIPAAHARYVIALAGPMLAASSLMAQSTRVWTDPANDAVVRRTDYGVSGTLIPGATLPDLTSVTIGGWSATSPTTDPYVGSFVAAAGAHLLRLDAVFKGLVCPPGPVSPISGFHVPTLFGASPLYTYIELDVDGPETGGESTLSDTYVAQAGRFGARPQLLAARAITSATDFEADCLTPPFFRRTGAEFALNLCGCFTPALISQDGNMNGTMEAGETFVVEGSFFVRTSGYQDASFAFGGFFPGSYDPPVRIRFKHSIGTDSTTVSLVFPLTMHGYALLNGLPEDPPANFDVADAVSVYEALADVIAFCNSQALPACTDPLAIAWAGRNANNYLNVTTWRATALAGTTYDAPPQSGLYAWTDIGFDAIFKDVNGDGVVTGADRAAVQAYINQYDGDFFEDDDQTVNGSVRIRSFGYYYSTFDLDYNGFVDASDLLMFPNTCRVNWDGVGGVNTNDFFAFLNDFFDQQADFNGDGMTNTADFFAFMSEFFLGCP